MKVSEGKEKEGRYMLQDGGCKERRKRKRIKRREA